MIQLNLAPLAHVSHVFRIVRIVHQSITGQQSLTTQWVITVQVVSLVLAVPQPFFCLGVCGQKCHMGCSSSRRFVSDFLSSWTTSELMKQLPPSIDVAGGSRSYYGSVRCIICVVIFGALASLAFHQWRGKKGSRQLRVLNETVSSVFFFGLEWFRWINIVLLFFLQRNDDRYSISL